jgi:hypothetical protein
MLKRPGLAQINSSIQQKVDEWCIGDCSCRGDEIQFQQELNHTSALVQTEKEYWGAESCPVHPTEITLLYTVI